MTSSTSFHRRIASNYLLYRGELMPRGVVEIDASGRILSVGSVERLDSLCNTEFYSGVMFAGMVNAHCHLELSHLRGAITEQCGFASFARQLSEARPRFGADEIERAMAIADLEMFNGGTVAVGDHSNDCSSLGVKERSPIHYHTFAEHFGLQRSSTEHLTELRAAPNSSLTLHSTYSVSDECFRSIATNGEQAPLSIHFMETRGERELFEGRGELSEWYSKVGFECDFLHYGSPARRIVECVPKDRSVILVHNVEVREEDIDLVMNHFRAPVHWAICPRSNRYISGGEPPVALLERKGLNICIGTDSLSSNHSLSMLEELRALGSVALCTKLGWATRGGAEALGLSDLGEVEVGRRPSLLVLSGADVATGEIGERSRIDRIV